MSSRTITTCDSCSAVCTPNNHRQWPACAANGWRYYDACSQRCEVAIRERVTRERDATAAPPGDTPRSTPG